MKFRRLAATLWIISGVVLLFLAFGSSPRNNAHLALGVVFITLGSAYLRRFRQP